MKSKNAIELVKMITGAVISIGVGTVVGNILHATTPKDVSKMGKVLAAVGGICIEGLVVAHAQEEAEHQIDNFLLECKEVMENVNAEEVETNED